MSVGDDPKWASLFLTAAAGFAAFVSVLMFIVRPIHNDIERLSQEFVRHQSITGHVGVLEMLASLKEKHIALEMRHELDRQALSSLKAHQDTTDRAFMSLVNRMARVESHLKLKEDTSGEACVTHHTDVSKVGDEWLHSARKGNP